MSLTKAIYSLQSTILYANVNYYDISATSGNHIRLRVFSACTVHVINSFIVFVILCWHV